MRQNSGVELKCEHCATGSMQPRRITLWRRLGRHWLTLPNYPVWRCDMCGTWEYDAEAWLSTDYLWDLTAGGESPADQRLPGTRRFSSRSSV
jgi:YgiT-type zinc finger domain-containing protein